MTPPEPFAFHRGKVDGRFVPGRRTASPVAADVRLSWLPLCAAGLTMLAMGVCLTPRCRTFGQHLRAVYGVSTIERWETKTALLCT